MSYNKKISDIVTRLVRLTHEGKVTWVLDDPPPSLAEGTDSIISLYFYARYSDSSFAIYREKFRAYNYDMDGYSWQEQTVFAVLSDDKVLWEETDNFSAVSDLLEAVRMQSVDLDGILQDLLNDDNN